MNSAIKNIETLLGIKLEQDDYKNPPENGYNLRKEDVEELRLNKVVINAQTMEQLLPHLKGLRRITISNSKVSNIGELLKFEVYHLSLKSVTFEDDNYDENIVKNFQLERTPGEFYIESTSFNAEALKDFERLTFFFITNCEITNFYAINLLSNLYQLELNNVRFGPTNEYPKPDRKKDRYTSFRPNRIQKRLILTLKKCQIMDMAFFQPFADYIWSITVRSSEVGNIAAIRQFAKMNDFEIDAKSKILQNNDSHLSQIKPILQHITCKLKGKDGSFDLKPLAPIADYFSVLSLEDCDTRLLQEVELFSNVSRLNFENCQIYLNCFFSIAKNVSSVYFTDSTLHDAHHWSYFEHVDTVYASSWKDKNGLKGLTPLLPLKHQLKRLRFSEEIEDPEALNTIAEFVNLEVLDISLESIDAIKATLLLPSLKKLDASFYLEEEDDDGDDKCTLDVSKLINIEHLEIYGTDSIVLTGFERLQKLKSLELSNTFLDVNHLPPMPQLKRLSFENDDYHIEGLSQFPNLECLKISSAKSIKLQGLHQLKVLDLSNNIDVEVFDCFDDLPNLEKLSLSEMYREDIKELIDIRQLKNLQKLKSLSFMETELSSLGGIEHLTNLEYLDLYETGLTDVSLLNQLKNLKEVNLAMNHHQGRFEILAQLDNPEIALFIGLPSVHFRIWKDVELWENFH